MNTIKNIHRIQELLSGDALQKLEAGAALHLRHAAISFKILNVEADAITVRVVQTKNAAGVYQDRKTLIERTKELFSPAFPDRKIKVQPVPYSDPAAAVVTPQWLNTMMQRAGIKARDIVTETGLEKTNLSAWLNGHRSMSQPVQLMFYYFFKAQYPQVLENQ